MCSPSADVGDFTTIGILPGTNAHSDNGGVDGTAKIEQCLSEPYVATTSTAGRSGITGRWNLDHPAIPSYIKRGSATWKEALRHLPRGPSRASASIELIDAQSFSGSEHPQESEKAFEGNGEGFRAECNTFVQKICERHFAGVNRLLEQMHSLEHEVTMLESEKIQLRDMLASNTEANVGAVPGQKEDAGLFAQETLTAGSKQMRQAPNTSANSKQVSHAGTLRSNDTLARSTTGHKTRSTLNSEAQLFQSTMSSAALDSISDEVRFELWPNWTKREKETMAALTRMDKPGRHAARTMKYDIDICRNFVLRSEFSSNRYTQTRNLAAQPPPLTRMCKRMILVPHHPLRIGFWDPLSFVTMVIECIYIPLQFFPLEEGNFQIVQTWASRLFWTADIPMSFITGFQRTDGNVVRSPGEVARHYMTTWFLLDMCLVLLDWVELCWGKASGAFSGSRIGKIFKSLRMLRVLRLARILQTIKLPESLSALLYFVKSEKWKIGTSILRIVLFLVIVNHFLACIWYGIASSDQAPTWLTESGLTTDSLWYQYLTSYHWALSQFSGTMDINPVNPEERLFTVAVGSAAFFGGALIISSITTHMTHWDRITSHHAARLTMLQDFLIDHKVSRLLTMKIVKSAQIAIQEQKRNTPEQRIDLLNIIPEPMKLELHHSLYMPSLDVHPFLSRYNNFAQRTMQGICHRALTRFSIVEGGILFAEGEIASDAKVYFVLSGLMVFVRGHKVCTPLAYPKFLCEAALWTPWFHQGTLVAKTDSNILGVSVEKFQEVVSSAPSHDYNMCLKYGRAFLRALNKVDDDGLTDLRDVGQFDEVGWLDKYFPLDEGGARSHRQRLWFVGSSGLASTVSTTLFGVVPTRYCWCRCCSRRKKFDAHF